MSQAQTHISGAASDIVELHVNLNQGQSNAFNVIDMDGRKLPPLVLGQTSAFVLTDVLLTPNVAEGLYQGEIKNPIPGTVTPMETRIRLRLDSRDQAMLHLALTGGVVFRKPPVAFAFASNPGAMVIRLLGEHSVNKKE